MAKIIEFYIPQSFRKVSKWLPPNEHGKLLEFPVAVRKSAWQGAESPWRRRNVRAEGAAKSTTLRYRWCDGETGIELRSLLVPKAWTKPLPRTTKAFMAGRMNQLWLEG